MLPLSTFAFAQRPLLNGSFLLITTCTRIQQYLFYRTEKLSIETQGVGGPWEQITETGYENCPWIIILCTNRWLKIEVIARQKAYFRGVALSGSNAFVIVIPTGISLIHATQSSQVQVSGQFHVIIHFSLVFQVLYLLSGDLSWSRIRARCSALSPEGRAFLLGAICPAWRPPPLSELRCTHFAEC